MMPKPGYSTLTVKDALKSDLELLRMQKKLPKHGGLQTLLEKLLRYYQYGEQF